MSEPRTLLGPPAYFLWSGPRARRTTDHGDRSDRASDRASAGCGWLVVGSTLRQMSLLRLKGPVDKRGCHWSMYVSVCVWHPKLAPAADLSNNTSPFDLNSQNQQRIWDIGVFVVAHRNVLLPHTHSHTHTLASWCKICIPSRERFGGRLVGSSDEQHYGGDKLSLPRSSLMLQRVGDGD